MIDPVAEYGYEPVVDVVGVRIPAWEQRVRCTSCGTVVAREGSHMRGHARRCEVEPRFFYIPGVCRS